jgi:hypothetical protein
MLITSYDRNQLLAVLPKGGRVAEVGVFRGRFAERILAVVEPSELHLIDLWARDDDDDYVNNFGGKPTNRLSAQMEQKRRKILYDAYEHVLETFDEQIRTGRVRLHRADALDVAVAFPDHFLDWINIDAMHDYENVLMDLEAFKEKVKPSGLILGHDYSNSPMSRKKGFGVVKAVRQFVAGGDYQLVLITNEPAPTYLLARRGIDTIVSHLINAMISDHDCTLIEIGDDLLDRYEQIEMTSFSNQKRTIIRFT